MSAYINGKKVKDSIYYDGNRFDKSSPNFKVKVKDDNTNGYIRPIFFGMDDEAISYAPLKENIFEVVHSFQVNGETCYVIKGDFSKTVQEENGKAGYAASYHYGIVMESNATKVD